MSTQPAAPSIARVRRVARGSDEYPPLLLQIPSAPAALFVVGRSLERAPAIAVVGTRRPSRYGVDCARHLAREFASRGIVVVSGMAAGIDASAHEGALSVDGSTVAVLGCGPDVCYPRGNKALFQQISLRGTVMSEYEPGTQPRPYFFPERNRIIAGMSAAAVVIEGAPNGGAMITARLAGEFGRDVFCTPGSVSSPKSAGPHSLIRDGARLVTSASDVIEDLGWTIPASSMSQAADQPHLNPDESLVLGALDHEPAIVERIAKASGLPIATTLSVLSMLEIKGLVARVAGGRFYLVSGP